MKNILVTLCFFTLFLCVRELSAEQLNLYDIDSTLINHNNEKVSLDQFKGHPVLVTMIYASCPSACPATISKIRKIVGDLPKEAAKELRVLLISFDPERDTPKTLKKVIKDHELDTSIWQLAIPEKQDDVRVLAAAIAMNFRKIENGEFGHTSPVAIVDSKGNVLHSAEITKDSEVEFVAKVKSLLGKQLIVALRSLRPRVAVSFRLSSKLSRDIGELNPTLGASCCSMPELGVTISEVHDSLTSTRVVETELTTSNRIGWCLAKADVCNASSIGSEFRHIV